MLTAINRINGGRAGESVRLSEPHATPPARRGGPRGPVRRRTHDGLKRLVDVVISVAALIVTAPLLAGAMIAIRIESPGPVLFRQRRMGHCGRSFEILKLRGMYVDARDRFPHLYAYSELSPAAASDIFFHQHEDPRVTRVGRVLRKTSIDELPNFWNVLKGDMSVVGPRPEIPELAHLYGDALEALLSVRPGVTSPAKASGRDALSFAETLRSDLDYVERRTLLLDLKTIARTAGAAMRGSGVH